MPGGHIFHRDLAWPFAESDDEVGAWGVETEHANVWLCGAGARRGGGVSGIPGHNAARAVLGARARRTSRTAADPRIDSEPSEHDHGPAAQPAGVHHALGLGGLLGRELAAPRGA